MEASGSVGLTLMRNDGRLANVLELALGYDGPSLSANRPRWTARSRNRRRIESGTERRQRDLIQ
jgi:hypothetical protein